MDQKHISPLVSPNRLSLWTNYVLCVLIACLIIYIFPSLQFPISIYTIYSIGLTEITKHKNRSRLSKFKDAEDDEFDVERLPLQPISSIATIVGYREEPSLYQRALESYQDQNDVRILIAGIDGNEDSDMEMVNVFNKVFPQESIVISLKEPLGQMSERIARICLEQQSERVSEKIDGPKQPSAQDLQAEARIFALKYVCEHVWKILDEHGLMHSEQVIRGLCVSQPHVNKKDIMFTVFIISLVLGQKHNMEFVWSSDSDTIVQPHAVQDTIRCIASDTSVGGAACAVTLHNADDSIVARLAKASYWGDMIIIRSQTAVFDANECQPGPCAAFRLTALAEIIMPWYMQKIGGFKPVVNEDRHLTTNLLLHNWKVLFYSEASVETDTPSTLVRWTLQQIRWARATIIETFAYPKVYALQGPLYFIPVFIRNFAPFINGFYCIRYVLFGVPSNLYSTSDLFLRLIIYLVYNCYLSGKLLSPTELMWVILSQLLYHVPSTGIHIWGLISATEGGWGTSMRNAEEMAKPRANWRERIQSTTLIIIWMGFIGGGCGRFLAEKVKQDSRLIALETTGSFGLGILLSFYALFQDLII
ncbi:hypothetical protein BP6252_08191 [Coleophoma cylindrospora]|uniref:Glycosyltransferase 2-like domain-containing protein n=1 Tax=Coleophoma cylindrospora TaxID=1849047 RepID=A0A3D8RCI2_9HELO|nr:hypothetical protein BP6252_08191 [Coleophoma cylindrospora]